MIWLSPGTRYRYWAFPNGGKGRSDSTHQWQPKKQCPRRSDPPPKKISKIFHEAGNLWAEFADSTRLTFTVPVFSNHALPRLSLEAAAHDRDGRRVDAVQCLALVRAFLEGKGYGPGVYNLLPLALVIDVAAKVPEA